MCHSERSELAAASRDGSRKTFFNNLKGFLTSFFALRAKNLCSE